MSSAEPVLSAMEQVEVAVRLIRTAALADSTHDAWAQVRKIAAEVPGGDLVDVVTHLAMWPTWYGEAPEVLSTVERQLLRAWWELST